MNPSTAGSLKSACTKVLGVLDNGDDVDIMTLDVEDVIHRFNNLCAREFTPSSLETYASRFRKSVTLFKQYVESPSTWKVVSRAPKTKKKDSVTGNESSGGNNTVKDTPPPPPPPNLDPNLIEYPYPLRQGMTIKLAVPADLTTLEVRKINAFLTTLTSDFGEDLE